MLESSSTDCCSWDGVKCNKDTGHIISLDLSSCCLQGFLNSNSSLFRLAHLQNLNLADNHFMSSPIPVSFIQLSRLTNLNLSASVFSGQIPTEFFELSKLVSLDLSYNSMLKLQKFGLTGIAKNFTNLEVLYLDNVYISSNSGLHGEFPGRIFHLPNLQLLYIGFNKYLTGHIPEFNRTSPLESLELAHTNFYGELPDSIGNLKSLVEFNAFQCNFSGEIPSSLGNLTNLNVLQLQKNRLHGSIPQSLSRLASLRILSVSRNHLSGTVELELFVRLKHLSALLLSGNDIALRTKLSSNSTIPKFMALSLGSCNLDEFPVFLRNQDQLELLDLGGNKIHGQLMRLDSNMLQGPPPVPPPSISFYTISDNTLAGEIPHLICNLSSIAILNLASNNLSGPLPQCLGNLSDSLTIVDVHNNNFHGTIPQIFGEGKELRMIDLSQNQLQGRIPRSLANCTKLEVLNLGNNQIHDIFPFWLGILPELRILILRSNEFFGSMGHSFNSPNLRIIDLSNNDITGKLPHEYFQNWKAMQIVDTAHIEYMEEERAQKSPIGVPNFFIAIDLSSNRLEGEIPEVVGHLKELNLLNLSHSFLTGPIPIPLANLTGLESLDLSQSKLSGPIPHAKQFDTFNNNSFSENPELCGSPLSKKCENPEDSPPPSLSHNSKFSFEFSWKVVAMGYGCGFMFGAVFGQIIITKKTTPAIFSKPNRRLEKKIKIIRGE
ncbi:hypothetical protein I3760_08G113200 [Carya illinoinensis]|nr:hypothetical protein I3760_08G113200 [Carya illinoinensis]